MNQLLGEVFGLAMSQGAIANLLSRVKGQLQSEVDAILATLRTSRLVCSDETSVRVKDLFAAVRSIVNTGRRKGFSAFEAILTALNPLQPSFSLS
jgi:histidyl-tRNA synthetase